MDSINALIRKKKINLEIINDIHSTVYDIYLPYHFQFMQVYIHISAYHEF